MDIPEVVSALDHFPGLSSDEAGDRLFCLFKRQAKAIEEVVTTAVSEQRDRLYRNELPSGSLLAMCFSRGHVEPAPASDYAEQAKAFMDRLSAPVLEFAFDEIAERVMFQGGHYLDGANFKFVKVLIENFRAAKKLRAEVPYVRSDNLATQLEISDQSMRQQLGRLRKALDPLAVLLGIPMDRDTFIQTRDGDGYRLNPEWREISAGDIRIETRVPSQAQ